MKTVMLCCEFPYDCMGWINLALALFAAVIAVGYFLRPRLFYCAFLADEKFKIRVINKNLLFTVKDIQCELAVSECKNYEKAKTLDLEKENTLMIRRYWISKSNYIFKTHQDKNEILREKETKNTTNPDKKKDYKYLRVRLLAPNFLGVKKHFERIYEIDAVTAECITKSQCYHNRQ